MKLGFKTIGIQLFGIVVVAGLSLASRWNWARATSNDLAKEPLKIAFILASGQEERYTKDIQSFKAEASKLEFEPTVVFSDNDEKIQRSKVESLIAAGNKAIVIQPVNSSASMALVEICHKERVPVVAYDRLIENAPVDFFVTQDSFQVGVLQAEAAVKATKGQGNFVILMGQNGNSVAEEITRGVLSVLSRFPRVKVVSKKYHSAWSPSLAMSTVVKALNENKKIDAILANNSGMAQGAVQALLERKIVGKVFVAGADADLASIKSIVAGQQQFEVLKEIAIMAQSAARIAHKLALGEKPLSAQYLQNGSFKVPVVTTAVFPVTSENLNERIFKSGFHSRKDVY